MWSRVGATGLSGSTAITFLVDVVVNTPPTSSFPAGVSAEATAPAGASSPGPRPPRTPRMRRRRRQPACPLRARSSRSDHDGRRCSVTDGGGLTDSGSFQVTSSTPRRPRSSGCPRTRPHDGGPQRHDPDLYAPDGDRPRGPLAAGRVLAGEREPRRPRHDGRHLHGARSTGNQRRGIVHGERDLGRPDRRLDGALGRARRHRWIDVRRQRRPDGPGQGPDLRGRRRADPRDHATLTVTACARVAGRRSRGDDLGRRSLERQLDTGSLGGPGCYRVTASLDGNVAGSFRLDLRGSDPHRPPTRRRARGKDKTGRPPAPPPPPSSDTRRVLRAGRAGFGRAGCPSIGA